MGWMEHLVQKGYIVVWGRYDAGLTLPSSFAQKALITWKDALLRIHLWGGRNHVKSWQRAGETFTAMVGHSAGGYLSAVLAAKAAEQNSGVPKPKAIVAIEPGGRKIIPGANFDLIPTETKFLIVLGDEDKVVCKSTGVYLWNVCGQVADDNKDFLVARSDQYGFPGQIADHKFPTTAGFRASIDARDFFITYKLTVAALNCAFGNMDCEIAFGNGSFSQLFMGRWSDGTLMKPMDWVDDPNSFGMTCMAP
jgi:pimeloyl-ACP methyl ester carboxylesterase